MDRRTGILRFTLRICRFVALRSQRACVTHIVRDLRGGVRRCIHDRPLGAARAGTALASRPRPL